jgi:hypothetical protein
MPGRDSPLPEMICEFMYYAREIETHNHSSKVDILDDLNYTLSTFALDVPTLAPSFVLLHLGQYNSVVFLALAIEANLHICVVERLDTSLRGKT